MGVEEEEEGLIRSPSLYTRLLNALQDKGWLVGWMEKRPAAPFFSPECVIIPHEWTWGK